MFDTVTTREPRPLALFRKAVLALVTLCALTAVGSGHRAYFQVRSLDVRLTEPTLRAGSVIGFDVSGSGRATVDVRLELIQGERSETLARLRVPGNDWPAFDPRPTHGSQSVALTPEQLAGFRGGAARLRATATGRPQWTRLPPPTVRETPVEIARD